MDECDGVSEFECSPPILRSAVALAGVAVDTIVDGWRDQIEFVGRAHQHHMTHTRTQF